MGQIMVRPVRYSFLVDNVDFLNHLNSVLNVHGFP